MSEIGFGIGVRTKCLILDVTSAESSTDLLLQCAHVRHEKIVYLNTRRIMILISCIRALFRVHK